MSSSLIVPTVLSVPFHPLRAKAFGVIRSWFQKRGVWIVVLAALLVPAARAASVGLGVLSFNTFIPSAPASPGVNDFEVDNFTGSSDLPPDFPVSGPLTFQNSSLLLTFQGGAKQTIQLGDLAPGVYTPNSLQFSATTSFTAALFTATLDQRALSLFDGSSSQASSTQLSIDLVPSSGATLTQDSDFVLIVVGTVAAPEPNFIVLELVAFITGLWFLRRLRRIE